jgi:hypothetical protein
MGRGNEWNTQSEKGSEKVVMNFGTGATQI